MLINGVLNWGDDHTIFCVNCPEFFILAVTFQQWIQKCVR